VNRRGAPVDERCPCGSGVAYAACCGRWHDGPQVPGAPDAPSLMRARYAAYVRGRIDFVRDTWHPATRPADLRPPDLGTRWLGLEVRAHEQLDTNHAVVTFVARSRVAGRGLRLHETSRFVFEQQRWWYVDGKLHEPGKTAIDRDR